MRKEHKNRYTDRFRDASEEELVEDFNREVGNRGWVAARAEYFTALHTELEEREIDYSAVGNESTLSFAEKIRIEEGKVIKEE